MSKDSFLDRINNKDRGAFHELFEKYYRPLVMFALRYVDCQEDAEDVVQDLFVAIWEREEKFLSEKSLYVFLYNSVRNTCLNLLKHKKVKERYVDYILTHEKEIEEEGYNVLEEELYDSLFKAVDELPPRCREIFLLHLDGKTNEEIARALNITILTVKTQKKKALHYLKGRLGAVVLVWLCGG